MKHYRSLLLLPFVLTGCATTDMQGALDSLNGLGQSIGTSLAQAAAPVSAANRNSLLGCARNCAVLLGFSYFPGVS